MERKRRQSGLGDRERNSGKTDRDANITPGGRERVGRERERVRGE
jgi:hypothetical protein